MRKVCTVSDSNTFSYICMLKGKKIMRILIIGGTRYMGPLVIRALSNEGHEILVFHRGQTSMSLPGGVKEILGDRRPLAPFAAALQRFEPDIVLDMIPMSEQDAQEIMSTFRGIAQRVVAISSQDVYRAFGRVNNKESGPVEPGPITEDSPLRENLYPYRGQAPRNEDQKQWMDDYDKILVERVVMGHPELPGTILRLPAVYGPGDYQHRMFAWLKRMDDNRPAILLSEKEAQWRWTHGYVENVTDAIALAVTDQRASGRIYNVGEPFVLTMAERIRKIGEAAGWNGHIVLVPHNKLPEPLRWGINSEQDIVVDSSRIRRDLGYTEQVAPDEAFRRTIDWERANPPAQIDPQDFDYAAEDTILTELA
jgi:nucleoside-diphosphate-sugar epimerase